MNSSDYIAIKTLLDRYGICLSNNLREWSLYPAISNINANNYNIINVSLINGGVPYTTVNPPPSGTVSLWSQYAASQNVNMSGNSIINCNDISTVTINGGTPYTTLNPQPHGHMIIVDISYGNDSIANAVGKYKYPYSTINAAVSAASVGDTVYIYPGNYVLSQPLIISKNIAIRGVNVQTVTISYIATTNTSLITINESSRIEDVTINLSSTTPNISLIGIDLSASSTIAKVRSSVINISTPDVSSTAIGVRSSGINSTLYASSDALRSITINIDCSGNSIGRGVYLSGANRLSLRDVNIYSGGKTNNAIGCEVVDPSGVLYLRACSTYGSKADISQPVGTIFMSSTDLVNSNANGYSFSTFFSPINLIYGINGTMPIGTYYLLPGTWTQTDIDLSSAISTSSQLCVHNMSVTIQQTSINGCDMSFILQRNYVDISGLSIHLSAGFTKGSYYTVNKSIAFDKNDKLSIKCIVTGGTMASKINPIIDLSLY